MILLFCAGNNANTIHYIDSVGGVAAGDLLLMDAGTEYHGYSSDITRTWPVRGGSFTQPQKM
jgi:Xaa-Pro aminopeptidase